MPVHVYRAVPEFALEGEARLIVSGHTFPIREKIKGLGGRWNPVARWWILPFELQEDEVRTSLGMLTEAEEEHVRDRARNQEDEEHCVRRATVKKQVKVAREEEAAKRAEKRRAALAAKNLELVKSCLADTSGKYSWVCCEQCEIVDLKKGHISCRAHAHWDGQSWCSFRVFGSVYTGN
jgi:hypothetical protein